MENSKLTNAPGSAPMAELANYHQQLLEKYKGSTQAGLSTDAQALMAFNGYYALNTAAGAFFAIDTNMVVQGGSPTPSYDITLLISLDGITSFRFPFTGTFKGAQLIQTNGKTGSDIGLTFIRTDGSDGTTATCAGTIKLSGAAPAVTVSGATYNNPIPAPLFTGTYYDLKSGTPVKVMSIDSYEVSYDGGAGNGVLQVVPAYSYNLNMYYFSFTQGTNKVGLIMGTAGAKGFACNNMVNDKSGKTTARQLQTILNANTAPYKWYDISGTALAGFSGYYPISSPSAPLAFVSIQAQYATISEPLGLDLYNVMITVSEDGVTSHGYYFNPLTMSFTNGVLTIPNHAITLTFNRQYDAKNGSLVSLTGYINGQAVNGYTLFNPIPLSVFAGVTMTGAHEKTLTVVNNNEVIYCGTKMDSIIYVPLMYILAYPITNTTIVMSFGTDGLKGNTCIVTEDADTLSPKPYFVYAIPNAQS